ncbi:MAG: DNA alkylation repair protein [Planctomycetes bacterium]|nr:DNA alkylation repair protein [Planctomycetota bacterium]
MTLLQTLRAEFKRVADPGRAPKMQAYMKSAMPYHGLASTPCGEICKRVFADYPFTDAACWRKDVLAIWRGATHREERYGAIALTGHRKAKPFQNLDALPMYEEMVVSGGWWDFVDVIAGHRLGALLANHPVEMRRLMRQWSRDENIWKRRSSIICQLRFKRDTDLRLLYDCIEPSLPSKEFFLRKAIGWALREYAWHDPHEVIRYVRARKGDLSNLSKREALKNVVKQGLIKSMP